MPKGRSLIIDVEWYQARELIGPADLTKAQFVIFANFAYGFLDSVSNWDPQP